MSRLFCICSFLLPMFAGVAFGEGTYQRTKDGKTIVWNNDPKPGDTAAWFGDRDAEGYATKVGTLTWYTSNGAVYARYFGNVVRGKFDGMVNVHFKGRTDHAIFVDGRQTTRWAAGRAPSFRVAQQPTKPAKPERTAEAPAEGPRVQKSEVGSRKLEHAAQQPALRESRTGSIEDTRAKKLPEQQAPPAKPAATAEPASASASAVAKPEGPTEGPPTVRGTENVQRPTSNAQSLREQAAQQPALSESRTGPMEKPASAVAKPEGPAEGPPTARETENVQRPTSNSESLREQAAQQPALSESRMGPVEDTPAKELSLQPAPPANPAAAAEPGSASASAVAEPEGPAKRPPTVRETENVQRPTSNSESLREQAAQRPLEEPASAMAEPEAPAEGPRVVQAESAFATSANRETRAGEGSSSPAEQLRSSSRAGSPTLSSEGFPEQATPLPMEDTPSLVIQPSKEPVRTPSTSKKSEAEVKDSLQSLRPPSSLLAIPQTAASPEASPRLTKQEVVNIANAKARTHGYNRTDYRRAEPQYNAAYKVWSVSYEQRTADGMEEAGEHFSVIVDDKTKGTVFMLRR